MEPGLNGPRGPHVTSHVESEQRHVQGHVTILLPRMAGQIARDLQTKQWNVFNRRVQVNDVAKRFAGLIR